MKKTVKDQEGHCPYFSTRIGVCLASLFLMAIEKSRREFVCSSDDWDDCPMFLSKTLRNKN